jgi:WD40 repeat protein
MAAAIEWSQPVKVVADDDGGLTVSIPEGAVEALRLSTGDVLCFTGFDNGTVEIWSVKKGTYSSLDDEGAAQQAMEQDRHDP